MTTVVPELNSTTPASTPTISELPSITEKYVPLLPALIVISLDSTLFPYLMGNDLGMPFRISNESDQIVDRLDQVVECYSEVPNVLKRAKYLGIKIAITSDNSNIFEAIKQLINLLGWHKYITYQAGVFPEEDNRHLRKIHNITGVPYDKMIYFSNWHEFVRNALDLGVFAVWVNPETGITLSLLNDGLKGYELVSYDKKNQKPALNTTVKNETHHDTKNEKLTSTTIQNVTQEN